MGSRAMRSRIPSLGDRWWLLVWCCLATLVPAPAVLESQQRQVTPDESPRYSVQLMTGAIPGKGVKGEASVVMTKRGGKRYRCYLPAGANSTASAASQTLEAAPHVSVFLHSLKGLCFYRMEGWWTYEFCFMRSMRQFHQEKAKIGGGKADSNTITQDYKLGVYWLPEGEAEMTNPGGTPAEAIGATAESGSTEQLAHFRGEVLEDSKTKRKYWRQLYGNGTHCDVTGNPRETELRLQCALNEPSHLASIEEDSTCHYVVQFRTSLLCGHPAFDVDERDESVQAIQCEPIDEHGQPLPPRSGAATTNAVETEHEATEGEDPVQSALQRANLKPKSVAFDLGQCFQHKKYNYRGVIVGFDSSCKQSEAWMRMMHVDALQHGRDQPFYHVLPDHRDRPGVQVTYVAQENIMPQLPPEALQHPLLAQMFNEFRDGRFLPTESLRNAYRHSKRS